MHHFTLLEYLLLCLCFRGGVVTPISILKVSVCAKYEMAILAQASLSAISSLHF